MDVIYDKAKARMLKKTRGINLDYIAEKIVLGQFEANLKNPVRNGQRLFVISYKGYMYAVPFIYDSEGNIVIKTAYASRKYQKLYGRER